MKQPTNKAKDFEIEFVVSGKAGEKRSISHTPSEDGVLRLFRVEKVSAMDNSSNPGHGSAISDVRVGGESQRSRGRPSTLTAMYSSNSLGSGVKYDTCHPRLPITIDIEFSEHCTWTGVLYGKSCEVQNEGVYSYAPTVPCDHAVPDECWDTESKYFRDSWYQGYWIHENRRGKCDHCWFRYGKHVTWPWRDRDYSIEAVIGPKAMYDFYVVVDRLFHAECMHVDGLQNYMTYVETAKYLDEQFRLRVFGAVGREAPLMYASDEKGPWSGFSVGCLPGVVLDVGEKLHIRVENRANEAKLFKATVSGDELLHPRRLESV